MTSAANCNDQKRRKAIDLPPGAKLAYTVDEAAQALGLSVATVWAMLKVGEITAKKLRGRTLVPRDELERVLGAAPSARAA
ncbi:MULTISPECIES: helix-turn-helix domain-containing protein [unclassified Brevundimonas]|uniref:helix-turn-helix domain-containing protein n=1 Tax=unclassified Brevundimonas TaxID=2622653 RepID=UPI0014319D66|nr:MULTISPECIES: helix-turn-helix domain-containing protein [unclassified Brevundimonas]